MSNCLFSYKYKVGEHRIHLRQSLIPLSIFFELSNALEMSNNREVFTLERNGTRGRNFFNLLIQSNVKGS
jgi:hypothetical protein